MDSANQIDHAVFEKLERFTCLEEVYFNFFNGVVSQIAEPVIDKSKFEASINKLPLSVNKIGLCSLLSKNNMLKLLESFASILCENRPLIYISIPNSWGPGVVDLDYIQNNSPYIQGLIESGKIHID
jgi:hypothetical protein